MSTRFRCCIALFCGWIVVGAAVAGPVSGAIFTTLWDGSLVNGNIYTNTMDVYLDGGPGPNAPAKAAGLPEGDYFFQVTDPSGKKLLSLDPVASRRVHVNAAGVIDMVYPAPTITEIKGKDKSTWGTHASYPDIDHDELGAVTVQLMPYKQTPNKGGVYKVWMTPTNRFEGEIDIVDNGYGAGYFHGFIPAWSKTDNYKVWEEDGNGGGPQRDWFHFLYVFKFGDYNANGEWDVEEPALNWEVTAVDPLGVTNTYWTPTNLVVLEEWFDARAPWTSVVTEIIPEKWMQTVVATGDSITNLAEQLLAASVDVTYDANENQDRYVVFGNVPLGSVLVRKFYDRDVDGEQDGEEPLLADWVFYLDGLTVGGAEVHLTNTTDATGHALFDYLLPGTYEVSELLPAGWICTTETMPGIELLAGEDVVLAVGNALTSTNADFGTKGYWHNKNGLEETTLADFDYLNSLLPWQAPSSYFDDGDEPINGRFQDDTLVPAAKGSWGEEIAPAGSAWAEQAQFLVDANAGGDPREQLAQQLDAFIMNARHRLPFGSAIWVPFPSGGMWVTTTDLIAAAVEVWGTGTPSEQNEMAGILDALNNEDDLLHIVWMP
jgi:hypothetical protein